MTKTKPKKVMQPRKVFELLSAMTRVHALCRELELPEILNMDAAKKVIQACVERGPDAVKEIVAQCFDGSNLVQ